MGKTLSLEPEGIEKRIHPRVLDYFRKFRDDIRFTVPLETITEADLDEYLKDSEKIEFQRYMNQITDELRTCIDIGDSNSPDYQVKVMLFELNTTIPMFGIKRLLGRVYESKVKRISEEMKKKKEEEMQQAARAEEEQREREKVIELERKEKKYWERWRNAYAAIEPPTDDARKYLNDEEYEKFEQSTWEAAEIYMAKERDYISDSGTLEYRRFLSKINTRKDEETRKMVAKAAANEYNAELNREIEDLRSKLDPQKKGLSTYLQSKIKDKRHTGHKFGYVLSKEQKEDFDRILVRIANERLKYLIPDRLSQFIDIPSQYYRIYLPLPSASYSFEGVPCLDFTFDVFAAACRQIWLKPGKKQFGDYEFRLPCVEGKDHSVPVQQQKFLGYCHLILKPEEMGGYVHWQSIPLVLIQGLMNGELQPAGTTILAASENGKTYRIKNFKEEITIPKSFKNYLEKMGNIEQMVNVGILDQEVANAIKESLNLSAIEGKTESSQDGQVTGFTDEELISSLTSLGLARKLSEELCSKLPRNLSLGEAIKAALQNQR